MAPLPNRFILIGNCKLTSKLSISCRLLILFGRCHQVFSLCLLGGWGEERKRCVRESAWILHTKNETQSWHWSFLSGHMNSLLVSSCWCHGGSCKSKVKMSTPLMIRWKQNWKRAMISFLHSWRNNGYACLIRHRVTLRALVGMHAHGCVTQSCRFRWLLPESPEVASNADFLWDEPKESPPRRLRQKLTRSKLTTKPYASGHVFLMEAICQIWCHGRRWASHVTSNVT